MAISHIPRSVGHNFTPEYQISSIPYIIDLGIAANIASKKYIKNAAGLIVGETTGTAAANGNDAVKNLGRITDAELFTDPAVQTVVGRTAGFTLTPAVKRVELPKISRWIQFMPKTGEAAGIEFAFSRKDILLGAGNGNIIKVIDNFSPGNDSVQNQFYLKPLEIRCTNIYLTDAGIEGKILVGLTSIDRSEFTEVVEMFLEVD